MRLFERRDIEEDERKQREYERHTRAFKREFEGWEFYVVKDEKGKKRTKKKYIGEYYVPSLSKGQRILRRVTYLLDLVVATLLFLFSAFTDSECNSTIYTVAFEFITAICLLMVLYHLIFYIATPGKMTIGDYNTIHKPLYRYALASAIVMGLTAVMAVISYFVHRATAANIGDLHCALFFVLSALPMLMIFFFERNLAYEEVPNA